MVIVTGMAEKIGCDTDLIKIKIKRVKILKYLKKIVWGCVECRQNRMKIPVPVRHRN